MDGSVRMLHVDDDPHFAEVVAELLRNHSARFDVVIESDLEAVLGQLSTESFDCVVSDYQMPRIDGLQLLDRVRSAYPNLPFVLFTGKGSEEIASEAIAAGVTDYVQKGTGTERVAILANRIENAVEQRRVEQRLQDSERSVRRKDRMLEAILEHVPIHVYAKDEQARHTWISDYGLGNPEQIGKTDAEYFDAEWAEETTREERELIETGEPIIDQERYDPERDVWVRNTKIPWRDEDGEVTGLIGASWDVTEQKQTQQERAAIASWSRHSGPLSLTRCEIRSSWRPAAWNWSVKTVRASISRRWHRPTTLWERSSSRQLHSQKPVSRSERRRPLPSGMARDEARVESMGRGRWSSTAITRSRPKQVDSINFSRNY
ncbi:response regulator [Halorhabdus salina]|nr:response regulator [Halorhabdus salina]